MAKDILSNLTPAKVREKRQRELAVAKALVMAELRPKDTRGKSRSGHKFKLWFEGGQMPLPGVFQNLGSLRAIARNQVINIETLEKLVEKKRWLMEL